MAKALDAKGTEPARGSEGSDFESGLDGNDELELRLFLRLITCHYIMQRHVRRNLRERFGITLPRFDLLAQLYRAPEGLSMGDLSRRLMVTGGNITSLIEGLVRDGLVKREPEPKDRRRYRVRLTDRGTALLDEVLPAHRGLVEEFMGGLSRADKEGLYALLGQFKDSLRGYEQTAEVKPEKPEPKE